MNGLVPGLKSGPFLLEGRGGMGALGGWGATVNIMDRVLGFWILPQ